MVIKLPPRTEWRREEELKDRCHLGQGERERERVFLLVLERGRKGGKKWKKKSERGKEREKERE